MGFIANLIIAFLVLPVSGILLLLWIVTQKKMFAQLLGVIWGSILFLILLSVSIRFFTSKMKVDNEDIYGEYIIDRTKFPGKNADWQYDHFRFEITQNNKFIFYSKNGEGVTKTEVAKVEFLKHYSNHRIRIRRDSSMHHIIENEPTLYRNVWSFYYVFKSPKYGNVFFKKGTWKEK